MKIKTDVIALTPSVIVALAVAYSNPEFLSWPRMLLLAGPLAIVSVIVAHIIDGRCGISNAGDHDV